MVTKTDMLSDLVDPKSGGGGGRAYKTDTYAVGEV